MADRTARSNSTGPPTAMLTKDNNSTGPPTAMLTRSKGFERQQWPTICDANEGQQQHQPTNCDTNEGQQQHRPANQDANHEQTVRRDSDRRVAKVAYDIAVHVVTFIMTSIRRLTMSRSQLATKAAPIEARQYSSFRVKPLTGSFGALIRDVQIADALDDVNLLADIRQAWLDYQVVFFRDQVLTPDQHLALGKKFGEIQKQGYAPSLEGHEGVWVQEYPALYSGIVADIDWHADSSFRPCPTRGSLLYALNIPIGGDTVWADQCAAYADLAPAWQDFLGGLTAIHDNMQRNLLHILETMPAENFSKLRKYLPPCEHPVVCTHPETGRRFLFVSELMTREITGMNRAESRTVLDFLFAHQTRPEYQCRFHWQPGSLALWDNFSTLHRGIFDFGQGHRLMHRVSFNTPWTPG